MDKIALTSSMAAAASAIVAAVQLRRSRLDANYRLTIDLLRDLAARLEAVMPLDLPDVRDHIACAYEQNRALDGDGRIFMSFLHAIELLADAREHGGVDIAMTDRFLRSLVVAEVIPLSFLSRLQVAQGDTEAYRYTRTLLTRYKQLEAK